MTDPTAVDELVRRVVIAGFEAAPAAGRAAGDHTYDGRLGDVGRDALRRREQELDAFAEELRAVDPSSLDSERRADVGTALRDVEDELFRLRELRAPATDPQWALWRGCDVSSYILRPYASGPERAEGVIRQLEQLPDWLEEAGSLLDPDLAPGPRDIAVGSLRGHAEFYRDEVPAGLGELDTGLGARLDAAVQVAAEAVERHARRLEAAGEESGWALGPERFVALLRAQEGVDETAASLRSRVDGELAALTARGEEVARGLGAADLAAGFQTMEALHPGRDELLSTAAGMLEELRDFWIDRDVVSVPADVDCTVRRSPSFYSYITAAFEPPGSLDPPGLPYFYYVTPVDASWTDTQADQWLRHLNTACLLNISVHEVYPGHFVHAVNSRRNPSLVRNAAWYPAFGEGWAHYTELLGIEQGLAERYPWVELAFVQDALLRAARFSATVGMHAEGRSLAWATDMMEAGAHVPRLAAEREALRGTWDPMYLSYTYGKLEILRWRAELERRPGFSLKRFHDRMVQGGSPPLSVMAAYVMDDAEEWLGA